MDQVRAVERLLQLGADPQAEQGEALQLARQSNNAQLARLLEPTRSQPRRRASFSVVQRPPVFRARRASMLQEGSGTPNILSFNHPTLVQHRSSVGSQSSSLQGLYTREIPQLQQGFSFDVPPPIVQMPEGYTRPQGVSPFGKFSPDLATAQAQLPRQPVGIQIEIKELYEAVASGDWSAVMFSIMANKFADNVLVEAMKLAVDVGIEHPDNRSNNLQIIASLLEQTKAGFELVRHSVFRKNIWALPALKLVPATIMSSKLWVATFAFALNVGSQELVQLCLDRSEETPGHRYHITVSMCSKIFKMPFLTQNTDARIELQQCGLLQATRKKDHTMMRFLLGLNTSPQFLSNLPMHLAVVNDDITAINVLVLSGISWMTALEIAVDYKKVDFAKAITGMLPNIELRQTVQHIFELKYDAVIVLLMNISSIVEQYADQVYRLAMKVFPPHELNRLASTITIKKALIQRRAVQQQVMPTMQMPGPSVPEVAQQMQTLHVQQSAAVNPRYIFDSPVADAPQDISADVDTNPLKAFFGEYGMDNLNLNSPTVEPGMLQDFPFPELPGSEVDFDDLEVPELPEDFSAGRSRRRSVSDLMPPPQGKPAKSRRNSARF